MLSIFDLAQKIDDEQMKAHFARYLAVLLCGLLETTVKTLVIEYSARTANPKSAAYCSSMVNGFRNPNCAKLKDLVGRFNADWRKSLEEFLEGPTGSAVDSIKVLRDAVAHGRNHGTSLGDVIKYRDDIFKTVDFLEKLFDAG